MSDMKRMGVLAAAAAVGLFGGCTSSPEPLPDVEAPATAEALANAEAVPDEPPAPEAPRLAPPARNDDALAWVEFRDGAVVGETGVAVDGESYVVRAVCRGAEQMGYVLLVDGEELGSAEWECDVDVINTAFEGAGQQVEVHLDDLSGGGGVGFAEVLPVSAAGAPED
ncbi:MAG: hypothetical protein GX596_14795 [Propionibacterium sp.]|nr:hypothetical protein [Propionibacterium sp.]